MSSDRQGQTSRPCLSIFIKNNFFNKNSTFDVTSKIAFS
jgi:protein associated with RNAse G/E